MRVEYPSSAMQEVMRSARLAARMNGTVLLTGETGCGKDFLARCIHEMSSRAGGPFRSVNCPAIVETLAESELFGYERGAFNGANKTREGCIKQADRGTLLFNEIGDMSPFIQAKLLTFLDERSFHRVGGEKPVKADVRIVAATNRDLLAEVETGRFRKDLFYRLSVWRIEIPPLRGRKEDIPLLVDQLVEKLAVTESLPRVPSVDSRVVEIAGAHDWPGNVRELRNVLERCIPGSEGGVITANAFAESLEKEQRAGAPSREQSWSIVQELLTKYDGRVRTPTIDEIRRIQAECVDKRMTQAQVADALGVSQPTVSRWLKSLRDKEDSDCRVEATEVVCTEYSRI